MKKRNGVGVNYKIRKGVMRKRKKMGIEATKVQKRMESLSTERLKKLENPQKEI